MTADYTREDDENIRYLFEYVADNKPSELARYFQILQQIRHEEFVTPRQIGLLDNIRMVHPNESKLRKWWLPSIEINPKNVRRYRQQFYDDIQKSVTLYGGRSRVLSYLNKSQQQQLADPSGDEEVIPWDIFRDTHHWYIREKRCIKDNDGECSMIGCNSDATYAVRDTYQYAGRIVDCSSDHLRALCPDHHREYMRQTITSYGQSESLSDDPSPSDVPQTTKSDTSEESGMPDFDELSGDIELPS